MASRDAESRTDGGRSPSDRAWRVHPSVLRHAVQLAQQACIGAVGRATFVVTEIRRVALARPIAGRLQKFVFGFLEVCPWTSKKFGAGLLRTLRVLLFPRACVNRRLLRSLFPDFLEVCCLTS